MLKDKYIILTHKKLSGQISLSEASELEKYRKQNPAQDKMLEEIEKLWEGSESYVKSTSLDSSEAKAAFFSQINQKPEKQAEVYTIQRSPVISRRMLSWVAAAALIVFSIGYFVFSGGNQSHLPQFMQDQSLVDVPDEVFDKMGQLADGTAYWLKEGSVLKLDKGFNKSNRQVYLEGELFLHVADNAKLPFKLTTRNSDIKVLGTAFYVQSDENHGFEIQVTEGSVEVKAYDQDGILLNAGDFAHADKDSRELIVDGDQNPVVSKWRKRYLVFRNEPLEIVFNKLAVFYGVEFDIACDKILKMKGFTSLIQEKENPKLDSYLISLQKVYRINIVKNGSDRYKVYGGPCK